MGRGGVGHQRLHFALCPRSICGVGFKGQGLMVGVYMVLLHGIRRTLRFRVYRV